MFKWFVHFPISCAMCIHDLKITKNVGKYCKVSFWVSKDDNIKSCMFYSILASLQSVGRLQLLTGKRKIFKFFSLVLNTHGNNIFNDTIYRLFIHFAVLDYRSYTTVINKCNYWQWQKFSHFLSMQIFWVVRYTVSINLEKLLNTNLLCYIRYRYILYLCSAFSSESDFSNLWSNCQLWLLTGKIKNSIATHPSLSMHTPGNNTVFLHSCITTLRHWKTNLLEKNSLTAHFYLLYSSMLFCCHSDSTESEDAGWDWTQDCCRICINSQTFKLSISCPILLQPQLIINDIEKFSIL